MAIIKEIADGFEGMGEVEEPRAATGKRVLIVDWATRKADAPALYTEFPGNANLKLVRRTFSGFGATGTGFPDEYTHCRVVLEYTNLAMECDGDPIMCSEFACEVLEVGGGRYWQSDGEAVASPLNVIYGFEEMYFEKASTIIPEGAIRECMNKLNMYSWTPPGRTEPCEPETLLYLGCSDRTQFDAETGLRHLLRHKFLRRQFSHNWFWRSDIGIWDQLDPAVYDLANFNQLQLV